MHLIYHPDAEAELIEAAQFYERRLATLGSQFLDASEIAIGVIQNAIERWRIIEADVRRYLMPCFICYLLPNSLDHIRILAFKHSRRHQDYWRYRLSNQTANT